MIPKKNISLGEFFIISYLVDYYTPKFEKNIEYYIPTSKYFKLPKYK